MESPDQDRLARLEGEIAAIRQEIAVLRGALRYQQRGAAAASLEPPALGVIPAAKPAEPGPRAVPDHAASPARLSFEEVVGRYGTLAVGTITVLVGVGVFINWAVARGLLGPEVRVALGALGAVGLAALGGWLRVRGTREFGNVLLALALAVGQVVCWGAGPHLHLVPPPAALAAAVIGSALLAEFALRHEEEALCAVGFGGAALAPFVTSGSTDHPLAVPAYGLAIIVFAQAAIGERSWMIVRRVIVAALALFEVATVARVWGRGAGDSIVVRLAPLVFPLAVSLAAAIGVHARHRRYFVRVAALASILAAFAYVRPDPAWGGWAIGVLALTAVTTAIVLDLSPAPDPVEPAAGASRDAGEEAAVDGAILPLGFLLAAIIGAGGFGSPLAVGLTAGWALLALFAVWHTRAGLETEWYAWTATIALVCVAPAAFEAHRPAVLFALVVVGTVLAAVGRAMPRGAFAAGSRLAMAVAGAGSVADLAARAPFVYQPFGTGPSLEAAVAVAGWGLVLAIGEAATTAAAERVRWRAIAWIGLAATAFVWGREELAGAWSATSATTSLVAYYGLAGALAIWVGGRVRQRAVRLVGLGLTLLAAGKTFVEAFQVPSVAVRVGLFFLVSAFLIGVAYWYRREAAVDV